MDVEGLRAAAASALATSWRACLLIRVTEGQPALKEALIEHLARKGISTGAESIGGVELRVVAPAELAAAGIWIAKWKRMLLVINATRGLPP